jgi:hypothetical protein
MSVDLTNYIGLKNCNLLVPESGDYINELPGMSTELVDKIANSEQINFAGVWADVQKNAFRRFKDDTINLMYEYIKFNSIIYQTRRLVKSQINALIPVLRSPLYAGVYQMCPESKYSEYRLNGAWVYSSQTITTTLKVWDVNDGSVIYTASADLIPGLNYVSIKQIIPLKYRILEMFIGIDVSNFDSIQTLNDYYYWYDSDMACAAQGSFGYGAQRGFFQFYPATFDSNNVMQYSNIIKSGIGRGITVDAEIRCSIDQFLYDNREILGSALLYLLAAEMLLHKRSSPRLNFYTASNLEQTEETRLLFEDRYRSNLKRALNTIPLTGESLCFDCEETFKVATKSMMP